MNTPATKHFRSYRPLRQRVHKHLSALAKVGFRVVQGHDLGWFGDGRYILSNGVQTLRVTRSRGEEFLEVAFREQPAEEQWFDISELLTAFGVVTIEDVVHRHAIHHDLDFKIPAYLKLYSEIDNELAHDQVAVQDRLHRVRQRSTQFARERYGSN